MNSMYSITQLSEFGLSSRILTRLSDEMGEEFVLVPENIGQLQELGFPIDRLLKPIIQSDDFSINHSFFERCLEHAPKIFLSRMKNEVSPEVLEQLVLREPVYALQKELDLIPDHLFPELLRSAPKATIHFAKSILREDDIENFCTEHSEIAIRHVPEYLSDADVLNLASTNLVLVHEYAKDRAESLGVDFSYLYVGREFDLFVDEFPSPKLPAMENHYISRLRCHTCGENSIRGVNQSYGEKDGSRFDEWDCICTSCDAHTIAKFNIIVTD